MLHMNLLREFAGSFLWGEKRKDAREEWEMKPNFTQATHKV